MVKRKAKEIIMSIDLGGSLTKIIGGINFEARLAFTMNSQSVEVPGELLHSELNSFTQANLSDQAWIKIEETYYAVGYLAQCLGVINSQLTPLKATVAIPKILAALWVVKEHFQLGNNLKINLSCLLPPGEIKDREIIKQKLDAILKIGFESPTGRIKGSLIYYDCKAEGAGLYMLHRSKVGKEVINNQTIAVIMIGYRNASITVYQRGIASEYETKPLGFSRLVKAVQQKTSGFSNLDLLSSAIAKYRLQETELPLRRILLSNNPEAELQTLKTAIEVSQKKYQLELCSWLSEVLATSIDSVLLCGGTVDDKVIQKVLWEFFGKTDVYLHASVDFPPDIKALKMGHRFGDIWCLWDYTINKLEKKVKQIA